MTLRRYLIAGAIAAAVGIAVPMLPVGADDHGIVVTCASVDVWNHAGLGTVTVVRTNGSETFQPGNALSVPLVNASGTVTAVDTSTFDYVVTAPTGCVDPTTTTTTTQPGATTTQPGATTTQPGATTTQPGATTTQPGATTTQPGATTTQPGATTTTIRPGAITTTTAPSVLGASVNAPNPAPGALPAAQPATPVEAQPRFTG